MAVSLCSLLFGGDNRVVAQSKRNDSVAVKGREKADTLTRGGKEDPLHPYPRLAQADIWVFAGQSNSQGWALLKEPVQPDPRILLFDPERGWVLAEEPLNKNFSRWTPGPVNQNVLLQRFNILPPSGTEATTVLHDNQGAQGGVGPALFFAKHLLKYVDRPIGLISCGVGSPISKWNPALKDRGTKSLYRNMLNQVAAAGGEIKGIVWYQGESDALTAGAADDYERAFLNLVDSIRRDTASPELPFIYVQIGRFSHPYRDHARNWEKIREVQRRVAVQRKHMHMVSAVDLVLEDSIHLGFEGYQRLGPRLAEIALTKVYRRPGHATPIDLESIEILQPENRRPMIRVRFSGVNGRLTSAGRPTGFSLRTQRPSDDPSRFYPQPPVSDHPLHSIYRVDIDPTDPSAVILGVFDNSPILLGKPHVLTEPLSLIYGGGLDPYVNIIDEKDIPLPAFGPVEFRLPKPRSRNSNEEKTK